MAGSKKERLRSHVIGKSDKECLKKDQASFMHLLV